MHPITVSVRNTFITLFNEQPIIFRSPGRINIIGEHTDYNDGFVLPAAIDKAVYIAIGPRKDSNISLFAVAYNETFNICLTEITKTSGGWPNYILGVVNELQKKGHAPGGFNMVIDADLPVGAGLSSSAALECATVFALNELFSLQLSKMEMIDIAQKAEHNFAGVMCGIMDQFASMFGRKGFVVKLDCRSMDFEYVPFDLSGIKILMLNTNVKHTLSSSEYNIRREECNKGLSWVQEAYPEVMALRDITEQMLDQQVRPRDKVIDNRCRYVVQEIERLQLACTDLLNKDLASVGKKMLATHDGLQNMYGVSCRELDYLVERVKNHPGVLGARMMGGGFG
ncbi:MAG: galactokinase, partial [Chitinophagaceae bacterium]